MQSQIVGSLTLECLKMGQTTFEFSNVLNVKKANVFVRVPKGTNLYDVLQYWSCRVERKCADDPTKRIMKGIVKFDVKQELADVKQLFLSVFGPMMCEHLSIKENEQSITQFEQKTPPDYFKHKMYQQYGYRTDLNGWDDDIY